MNYNCRCLYDFTPDPVDTVKRWCSILRRGPLETAPGVDPAFLDSRLSRVARKFRPKLFTPEWARPPKGVRIHDEVSFDTPPGRPIVCKVVNAVRKGNRMEITAENREGQAVKFAFTNWLRRQQEKRKR